MAYGIVHYFPGGNQAQYEASIAAVHPGPECGRISLMAFLPHRKRRPLKSTTFCTRRWFSAPRLLVG